MEGIPPLRVFLRVAEPAAGRHSARGFPGFQLNSSLTLKKNHWKKLFRPLLECS